MAEPSVVDMSLDGPIHREAFERRKEEIRGVPLEQLLTVNVEPFQAVTTTLRSLPAVRGWRARLVKEFTSFDPAHLDKLGDYAMAYFHTVVADQAQSPLASEVEKLQEECAALCSVLDADLRPLVERGIISGAPLKERKG